MVYYMNCISFCSVFTLSAACWRSASTFCTTCASWFPQQSNDPVFSVIAVWILRLQALCLLQEVLWPQLPRLVMPSVWSVCLQVQLQLTLVYLLATSLQSRAWCMTDINSIIMCKAGYWKIKVLTSLSFQTHFITKFNFFIPFICCIKILFF